MYHHVLVALITLISVYEDERLETKLVHLYDMFCGERKYSPPCISPHKH